MFKMIVIAMSFAGASDIAQNVVPRPVTMQDLTVPKERLPAGCGLAPAPSGPLGGNRVQFGLRGGLPANPWTGTDRRIIASIRQVIDPPPPLPDAPLTTREAARFFLEMADGVEEGYGAFYTQSEPQEIVVYALRFGGTEMPFHPPGDTRTSNGRTSARVEIGTVVAIVSGDGGECFQAIEAHLRSLGT
jgi:hypothetical protein